MIIRFLLFRATQKILICCLLLIATTSVFAQETWSLQKCVEHALKNNLSVKQQAINTELSKVSVSESKFDMLPTLNGSSAGNYNWGRSVDPFAYTFTNQEIKSVNISLNGNVNLFNGFLIQNTLKQSQLNYLASEFDLKKIQNDISLNVVSAYLQVLFAKEQLKVMDNRVNEAQQQRDRAKSMVDAGTMPKGNLLDAESQLSNEELNKITADNQLINAKLTLIQLLELESIDNFEIVVPSTELPPTTVMANKPEQIYTLSLTALPEIKSAALKVESAKKGILIANSGYMPRLNMFGSVSSGYSSTSRSIDGLPTFLGYAPNGDLTQNGELVQSPIFSTSFKKTAFGDQLDNNLNKSVGLSVNVPIFNGFSAKNNVSRAKLNFINAQVSEEQVKNNVYKSIQQAYTDAIAAQKKYYAVEKSVVALQESYDYSKKRFEAGVSNSLEFLTSTNNLTKGKVDLLQSKYDYIFKVKVLDFYAGIPLSF
jgi:outer membrane protein